jgi:hypothetical protein
LVVDMLLQFVLLLLFVDGVLELLHSCLLVPDDFSVLLVLGFEVLNGC